MTRALGPRGAALIKSYETLRLKAYLPTINDKWTIGWGHTRGVKPSDTCTEAQAEAWFREDVAGAEIAVNRLAIPLTEGMFDALVSLVFNAGPLAIVTGSSIALHLEAKDYFGAWGAFTLWRKQRGGDGKLHDLLGLARRRVREMTLFLEDGLP